MPQDKSSLMGRTMNETQFDSKTETRPMGIIWQTVRQSYEPVLTVGLNVLSSNLLASSSSCRLIVWGIPG
jgi:hypothetical protein